MVKDFEDCLFEIGDLVYLVARVSDTSSNYVDLYVEGLSETEDTCYGVHRDDFHNLHKDIKSLSSMRTKLLREKLKEYEAEVASIKAELGHIAEDQQ